MPVSDSITHDEERRDAGGGVADADHRCAARRRQLVGELAEEVEHCAYADGREGTCGWSWRWVPEILDLRLQGVYEGEPDVFLVFLGFY